MRWRLLSTICAGAFISSVAPDLGNAASQPDPAQASIAAAKSYIEDGLKDPLSAYYRHIEASIAYSTDGQVHRNVCGMIYAKNGRGTYDGGARFVVGLTGSRPIGMITDMDDNREGAAIFLQYGERVCSVPFSALWSELESKRAQELAADLAATEAMSRCSEVMKVELASAARDYKAAQEAITQSMKCMNNAVAEHREAYSQIVGFPWKGAVGVH